MQSSDNRIIVVGDVHGCASELLTLLDKLDLTTDTTLLFLGDYIDRGPHSKQVIDLVLEAREQCRVVALMGNHEAMLMDFLYDRTAETAGLFVFNGGGATLASYADESSGDYFFPQNHLDFFEGLESIHQTEDYFFVHAGVPDLPLDEIDPGVHLMTLLWTRSFLKSDFPWTKVIVHGHTHIKEVEALPHRINVDTGCVYNGMLSAIELPSGRVFSVPRMEKYRPTIFLDQTRRSAVRFRGALAVLVQRGDAPAVEFETMDYSEIGMFIRLVSDHEFRPLEVGEVIFGTIGKDAMGMVKFRGRVVRELKNQEGLFYGVELTHLE